MNQTNARFFPHDPDVLRRMAGLMIFAVLGIPCVQVNMADDDENGMPDVWQRFYRG
jgi:hypothetical protein